MEVNSEASGDLDGDGLDEVAVAAVSCMAGSAGPDYYAVFRGRRDGKLVEMPFAKEDHPNMVFPHMNPHANVHGGVVTTIVAGRLIQAQGIYKEDDGNCCPTGGTRRYFYRWNGSTLELKDIVDSPEILGSESSAP